MLGRLMLGAVEAPSTLRSALEGNIVQTGMPGQQERAGSHRAFARGLAAAALALGPAGAVDLAPNGLRAEQFCPLRQ